jgi:GTP:adenosylcobinamide-phosphate guanylyltransferase
MPATLTDLFLRVLDVPSEVQQHCGKLQELASGTPRVVELVQQTRTSFVAFLAGRPKSLVSYTRNDASKFKESIQKYVSDTEVTITHSPEPPLAIPECDLLFINDATTAAQMRYALKSYADSVKHYLVIHYTTRYGEVGADSGVGVVSVIQEFVKHNPAWSVVFNSTEGNGLMVLSCQAEDMHPLPKTITQVQNALVASLNDALQGGHRLSAEAYDARLNICALCEFKSGEHCSACGCPIKSKARMASQHCPKKKWPGDV